MKLIPLTQGKSAVVDDADYETLNQHKWHAYEDHNTFYAQAHDTPNSTIYMHRVILGAVRGERVDHRDGNGLNNLRSNLRKATHQQNMWNRKAGVGRLKGVTRSANPRKWRARIMVGRKEAHLGLFSNPILAAFAYDRKARELFGEFARTNFSPEFEDGYCEMRKLND